MSSHIIRALLGALLGMLGGGAVALFSLPSWRDGAWIEDSSGRWIVTFSTVYLLVVGLITGFAASVPSWLIERNASRSGETLSSAAKRSLGARAIVSALVGGGLVVSHGGIPSFLFVAVLATWFVLTSAVTLLAAFLGGLARARR